jgi:hypothetical protein
MSIASRRASLSVLVLAVGGGLGSAEAQTYRPGYGDPYDGRGYNAPPSSDYGDRSYNRGYNNAPSVPNYGDPYAGRGLGDPYAPRGYNQPSIPPARSPYGGSYLPPGPDPREYRRDAYRPTYPAPYPGDFGGYGPASQPPAYGGSPRVAALADVLIGQVDAFIQVFSQTAHVVPEGGRQLADAQALSGAAHHFRQVAVSGIAPAQLSIEFRAVEDIWHRMSGRTHRIAKGRTGPNIQQIALMGNTIQQIRLACP